MSQEQILYGSLLKNEQREISNEYLGDEEGMCHAKHNSKPVIVNASKSRSGPKYKKKGGPGYLKERHS